MSTTWSRTTRYVVAVGLALFGVFVLYLSRPVLPLLIMAAVLSFLLLPIINFLHKRLRMPRGLAVILTYLAGIMVFALAFLFIIPVILNAVRFVLALDFGVLIESGMQTTENWLLRLRGLDLPFAPLDEAVDEAVDSALDSLQNAAPISVALPSPDVILRRMGSVAVVSFNLVSGFIGSVLSPLVTGIFVLLLSIYISVDAHKLRSYLLRSIPEEERAEFDTLITRVQRVWRQFLRGQVSLMGFIGVFVWLGLSLLGLPYALLLGIVAGLCEMIPSLGPFLATIPAVVVALLQGSSVLDVSPPVLALIVIVFYGLVQQIENSIVIPRLLGDAVNLHPVVVMSGILVGASVAGVLGALLALPFISSAKEIASYLYRKAMGMEAFPQEEAHSAGGESLWQTARRHFDTLRARAQAGLAANRAQVTTPADGDPRPLAQDGGRSRTTASGASSRNSRNRRGKK